MWLDSGIHKSEDGRFDILTAAPRESWSSNDIDVARMRLDTLCTHEELADCPFPGGVIGYLEYEALHQHYSLEGAGTGYWALFDWAFIQDHQKQQSYAVFLSDWTPDEIETRVALLKDDSKKSKDNDAFSVSHFHKDISHAEYDLAFKQIQRYILEGDCYQINFAQRFSAKFQGDPALAYAHARKALSGPYSSFMDFGSHQVLCFSPEQFISIDGVQAQTKPIKGTIRRSADPHEDRALAKELLSSKKNQSENLMIVDLLRNDFGKNCVAGSVKVPALYSLESYQNVHHLVSTVTGELKHDINNTDFFDDCFPGGSITGAPKKRAMEIIHELEAHPRRVYCGSVVCLGANQKLHSNIAIRTLLIEGEDIYCWGGGGIVSDSTVEEEYAESLQKIRILLDTLTGSGS